MMILYRLGSLPHIPRIESMIFPSLRVVEIKASIIVDKILASKIWL